MTFRIESRPAGNKDYMEHKSFEDFESAVKELSRLAARWSDLRARGSDAGMGVVDIRLVHANVPCPIRQTEIKFVDKVLSTINIR